MNIPKIEDSSSKPLAALLISNAFNPITTQILEKFKKAKEHLENEYEIVNGFISLYSKKHVDNKYYEDAIPLHHRLEMIKIAINRLSWIKLDEYESSSEKNIYKSHEIIHNLSNLLNKEAKKPIKVFYFCESNQIIDEEIKPTHLENYGLIIIEGYHKEKDKDLDWEEKCKEKIGKLYEKDVWKKFKKEIICVNYNESTISSENIRKMIINNDENWKNYYTGEIITYIEHNKPNFFKTI
ncbi:10185_t:CDS:1 [Racocetra persica]|uniref:10185_t:CDS:1 n=1 Tax=Racocetra persica TaxID=160502 RepID=A0ACA9R6W4_9GLOM|nr:10185_t:CDS:1 [Racocetra persica]